MAGQPRSPLRALPLCWVTAALLLAGCAPDGVVDGRPYALTLPSDHDGQAPLPLVVLLHGFSANGPLQDFYFDVASSVDDRGFILAVPNGTLDRRGRRFWNGAEACCQPADLEDVDDVAHLRAVIADVKAKHPVDGERVFLLGHSNGGFMALRMACEAGDVVSGVASVAGAAFDDFARCPAGRAVPILQLHGTRDRVIRFEGGRTDYGTYPGAEETTLRFARRNGCGEERTPAGRIDLEQREGDETVREPHAGCPPGAAVELWRMEEVGHQPDFRKGWAAQVFDWLDDQARAGARP